MWIGGTRRDASLRFSPVNVARNLRANQTDYIIFKAALGCCRIGEMQELRYIFCQLTSPGNHLGRYSNVDISQIKVYSKALPDSMVNPIIRDQSCLGYDGHTTLTRTRIPHLLRKTRRRSDTTWCTRANVGCGGVALTP